MISWTTYLTAVGIFLAIYYAFVVVVYFRKELFFRRSPSTAGMQVPNTLMATDSGQPYMNEGGFQPVSLIDEIHAYMNQAAHEMPIDEQELITGVKAVLQKYPTIEDSFLRLSINDLVVSLAETKCNVEISPEQIARLWK